MPPGHRSIHKEGQRVFLFLLSRETNDNLPIIVRQFLKNEILVLPRSRQLTVLEVTQPWKSCLKVIPQWLICQIFPVPGCGALKDIKEKEDKRQMTSHSGHG